MWSRFGSPTDRADSGTKEEFLRAYKRWKETGGKDIKIMFYFKNAPILPDNIDIEQIKFVKDFKHELNEKGGLYGSYKDSAEFTQLLRIHLNNAITSLVKTKEKEDSINPNTPKITEPKTEVLSIEAPVTIIEDEQTEEIGLAESLELSLEKIIDSAHTLQNMSKFLNELSEKTNERTDAINRTQGWSLEARSKEIKKIMDKVSIDLTTYVKRTKIEISLYKESFEIGIKLFTSAYSVLTSLAGGSDEVQVIRTSLIALKAQIIYAIEGTSSFRLSLQAMPNVTPTYKKAKREALEVLNDLIKELDFSSQLIEEIEIGI
ncbi:hypothetical protein [Flavisolibacter tropicus]|uniref:hypothetical protein n=1 Tax=Flavisolibacter tropicus TaxID=1492898 RepID=UPI0008355536|nr:hypothetical protein [Flavisolibacter tropicus]